MSELVPKRRTLTEGERHGGQGTASAPSAALVAAVQLAAAEASGTEVTRPRAFSGPNPEAVKFSPAAHPQSSPIHSSPYLRPGQDTPLSSTGPRRRWSSMTDEEIMTGVRRSSKEVHPGLDLTAYPSPGMSPAVAPSAWRSRPAHAFAADAGARRRWASLSDDETASPMLWPMRSPVLHAGRGGRRSQSGTPMMGPTAGTMPGLAKVSEHAVAEDVEDFMLPPTPQPAQANAAASSKQIPMTPENYPMAWPYAWEPAPMMGFDQAALASQSWQQGWMMRQSDPQSWPPQPWPEAGGLCPAPQVGGGLDLAAYAGPPAASNGLGWVPMGAPSAAEISQAQLWFAQEQMAEQQPPAELSGSWMQLPGEQGGAPAAATVCSLVWIGERAFRAAAATKEQIESLGYSIKVYRSHDRCSRMLDKKGTLASNTVFLVSEAEAQPMLQYLHSRGATGLRVAVDAEGFNPQQAWELSETLPELEESCAVRICSSWDELMTALCEIYHEAFYLGAAGAGAKLQAATSSAPVALERPAAKGTAKDSAGPEAATAPASDNPWTLVWISDQAFKPTAVSLKVQLEALGCQVKGYKTHKNAARALDKKRALVRTIVMVTGAEAPLFLQYIASRPELAATPVVVEATSRSIAVKESPTVQVCDSFDAASAAVWKMAHDPGFA